MIRALLFALGGLGLHVALSVLFLLTVGRAHDTREMDARWLAGDRPVRVMIAGDSHARFGVEAPVLGSAINVAVPGEHYLKTLYRVRWLLRNGSRRVQTVVLPFDAASFSSFKSDSFAPEAVWGRYVDFHELGAVKDQRFRYAGKWAKARGAPYVGELQTILQFVTATKHFRDPDDPGLGLTVTENGATAARRHLEGANPWDPDMEWAFRRILEGCRRARLRVVLVRYPVTALYARESRRLGADPALRDALLEEVLEPGVVDHLDFEDVLFGQVGVFGDGDHLNPFGRRIFSLALADELRGLGVLPPAAD